MLLETLDLKTNDILIYSQNMFNFNDSFKIIYKNDPIKTPKRITYFDVCNYVKDPTPKNLIVYRLLTNVQNLDAYSTKYGYFIKINGRMELIYFDPIFAIKDLRHLRFDLDPARFRFKIQQLGLTSLTRWEKEPYFAEVYSFDLHAVEAQNQNDKIFADAIFAFDPNYRDAEEEREEVKRNYHHQKLSVISSLKEDLEKESINSLKNLREDQSGVKTNMVLPELNDNQKIQLIRDEIVNMLKAALGIDEKTGAKPGSSEEAKIVERTKEHLQKDANISEVLDLFKSTLKSGQLSSREKLNIILKFTE